MLWGRHASSSPTPLELFLRSTSQQCLTTTAVRCVYKTSIQLSPTHTSPVSIKVLDIKCTLGVKSNFLVHLYSYIYSNPVHCTVQTIGSMLYQRGLCVLHSGDGGQQDRQPEPVGHGRAGGVRQIEDAILPPDQRLHHLLFHLKPCLIRKRQTQVASRGWNTNHVYSTAGCLLVTGCSIGHKHRSMLSPSRSFSTSSFEPKRSQNISDMKTLFDVYVHHFLQYIS